jgi:hypothetical protein
MKKLVISGLVISFALAPMAAHAARFIAREEYAAGAQERINENIYLWAGSASVAAPIEGDVVVGGGTVSLSGSVDGDILAAGGSLNLLGSVLGDVRVAGGQIVLGGRIRGDVVVAGGTITVMPDAVIDGGVYAAGGKIIIDGAVRGSVSMVGGQLTINGVVGDDVRVRLNDDLVLGERARIQGDLSYKSPREAQIAIGAVVTGSTTFTPKVKVQGGGAVLLAIAAALTAMELLASLGLAALLVWKWHRPVLEVLQHASERFGSSMGWGLVYGIATPVAAVLLLISFVGSLVGVLAALLYVSLLILTKAMAGMLLGALLVKGMKKHSVLHLGWGSALGGIVLLQLIELIPFVGWLVSAVFALVVFGALAQRIQKSLS